MKRFAAFALLALAGAARGASASGFAAPAPGARLAPGRSALASFELPRGLFGIEEMELVLSLDGGETFPLRLTGELSPGTRRVGWRVPALPTSCAVLGLRAGENGGDERLVLVSGLFTILRDPAAPPDDIRFSNGEWRTREAGFDRIFPFSDGSLEGGREERLSALEKEPDLAGTRSPRLEPSLREAAQPAAVTAVSSLPSLLSEISRVPVRLSRRE